MVTPATGIRNNNYTVPSFILEADHVKVVDSYATGEPCTDFTDINSLGWLELAGTAKDIKISRVSSGCQLPAAH